MGPQNGISRRHMLGMAAAVGGLAMSGGIRRVLAQPTGGVECAPGGGQFHAAVLTGCWAWRSSYCAGLR